MDEIVVIYYSRTGVTLTAALQVANVLGCPKGEIADAVPRVGAFGDLRCVVDTLFQRKVEYRYSGPPLASVRSVIVMAPVWMGRLAAPMRSFLEDAKTLPRHVAAATIMTRGGGLQAAQDISGAIGREPYPVLTLVEQDILSGAAHAEIRRFADACARVCPDLDRANRPAWLSPHEA